MISEQDGIVFVPSIFSGNIGGKSDETVCLTFGVLKAQHRTLAELHAQMVDVDESGWQANFTAQLLN